MYGIDATMLNNEMSLSYEKSATKVVFNLNMIESVLMDFHLTLRY